MELDRFHIREHPRARHIRITIHDDGRMVVTKPPQVSMKRVERFIQERQTWIEEVQAKFGRSGASKRIALPRPRKNSKAYTEAREQARALVVERLRYFNTLYGFTYGTISIRNQKTRWGSCSAAGNLSFNYRLVYLPPELADYVIVHELCHTKEHNHSKRFWELVAKTIPEYVSRRVKLRREYV